MFDLHCKITIFFADDQIFAAFEPNNSIKLDKTRHNSMRGLPQVVTLQWNSEVRGEK